MFVLFNEPTFTDTGFSNYTGKFFAKYEINRQLGSSISRRMVSIVIFK